MTRIRNDEEVYANLLLDINIDIDSNSDKTSNRNDEDSGSDNLRKT